MTRSRISRRVFLDRMDWVDRMLSQIRALPLSDRPAFLSDPRNIGTAESCLRRALEAVFDAGRHLLAKGFASGVSEYRQIAEGLAERGVLAPEEAGVMRILAGYRNRLVHFYHEVTSEELYQICATQLGDVTRVTDALRRWVAAHSDLVDQGP